MSLIEIKGLCKEYADITPLKNVDLNIEEGEVVTVIGPSGTGKSTLMRCINRLETPTSGSIIVDGTDVCAPNADLPAVRRKMGMVFQQFNLFSHKMIAENIMMPQQALLGKTAKEAYDEAMLQLRRVGLESKARKYPDELSGGQKQRAAIARALAMHPKILLFDEPTSALDPTMVSEVLSVIRELARSGLTIMIVTHEMRLARDISTRVIYMDEGGVYEQGTPEQIFGAPQRERTRNFIFRIRSKEYSLEKDNIDLYEMLGSLEEFCRDRFLSRKASRNCRLTFEELVTSCLLPKIEAGKGSAVIRVLAEEESGAVTLEAEYPSLMQDGDPIDSTDNELSMKIIENSAERVACDTAGKAVFRIRTK